MAKPAAAASGVLAHLIEDMERTVPTHLLPHVAKPEQVAIVVQTTVDALAQDRYRRRGIPFTKIAGRVRYLRQDVLEHLAANRMTRTGGAA